jgi:hypothetical protein
MGVGNFFFSASNPNTKNPPSLYNANEFYRGNCLYGEPWHTDYRSRIVCEIRPIRAQLAHPFATYLYKKGPMMSTHTSILVDSVGPPSAEVCRTTSSFPSVNHPRFIELREEDVKDIPLKQPCN